MKFFSQRVPLGLLGVMVAAAAALQTRRAEAIINQVDGEIVPQTDVLQTCLNKNATPSTTNPAPGEGPNVLNAVTNAAITPQTFVPAVRNDGRRIAQFTAVGEGAGYQNRFGWYNVGDSPFTFANRREIYACRDRVAACDCPCTDGPRRVLPSNGTCTTWINPNIVELDFDCYQRNGQWRGGPVAFYIMTPEQLTGGDTPNCPPVDSTLNRIYSTDNSVNDDGDYVHFLIYTSRTFRDSYYFGWEDLFRGGDNDFEDLLVRSIGLVPTCNPRPEVCDGVDNNCNGVVDEGLGTQTCGVGACMRTVETCVSGRPQTCVPGTAVQELCDGLDNNCNGTVDEGVSRACSTSCGAGTQYCSNGQWGDCVAPQPQAEVCDGRDNDCNGRVDDGLTRSCASRCGSGIETCVNGMYGGCTAAQPQPETCNGVDDDCNGLVDDGIAARPCRTACGAGQEVCIGGAFVCNAPRPRPEVCDGADNDCNGMTDDNVAPGGTCGSSVGACRPGSFVCRGGRYVCEGETVGGAEVCDGIDNNCNGLIDEGNPGGGAACMTDSMGNALCAAGRQQCRDGRLRCEGGTSARPEVCNCMDDDCDGQVDEDAPGSSTLCPGGGRCIGCRCATPCLPGEFPCSVGLVCNAENFCVRPLCGNETCTSNQVCVESRCVDLCSMLTCPMGQSCTVRSGRATCVENNCYGLGCEGAQVCRGAACVNNACLTTTCAAGQFCRLDAQNRGQCVRSCGDVRCPPGQSCADGACVADRCQGNNCMPGTVCRVDGATVRCVADPCLNVGTSPGRICENGRLVDDPCVGVTCPGAPRVQCVRGQCVDPGAAPFVADRVIGTGGDCSARPGPASSRGLALALGSLAWVLGLRRRSRRRTPVASRAGGVR